LPFDTSVSPSQTPGSEAPAQRPGFHFDWQIDGEVLTATVTVDLVGLGWVGLGIAELTSGSMVGADVVQMQLGSAGQPPVLRDGYTVAHAAPIADQQQDWVMLSGGEADGKTTFVVSRKLVTHDQLEDRPLLFGSVDVKMIFAFNPTTGAGFDACVHQQLVYTLSVCRTSLALDPLPVMLCSFPQCVTFYFVVCFGVFLCVALHCLDF
jgi:hypothetical protein